MLSPAPLDATQEDPTASARVRVPAQLAALLAAVVMFALAHSAYFLLPKYLELELHADASQIGIYMAATWLANVAFVPFVGVWVDRRGRMPLAYLGGAVMAATCVGYLAVERLGPYLLALRLVHGLGFTAFFVATSTLAADLAPPARLSQVLGWYGSGWVFSNAAAPAFFEWLADAAGWRWVFGATAVLAALSLALLLVVREHAHTPSGDGEGVPGIRGLFERAGLARMFAVAALAGVGFAAAFTFHQPFALSLGIARVSDFLVAYSVAAVIVRGPFGAIADRAGRVAVTRWAVCAYAVASLLMTRLESLGLVVTGAAFGVAHGLFYPALSAAALEGAAVDLRGKLTALFNGAFNAGFSLGSLGLGYVALGFGYPPVYGVACVCSLAALGLLAGRARGEDAD
jgi:MFS family permease